MQFENIAVAIYAIGVVAWVFLWQNMIGFDWLKKERLMHLPFWGGTMALLANMVLAHYAEIPQYSVELSIYEYVESNAKTIATFGLGIAVFVVVTLQKSQNVLGDQMSNQFLKLVFTSFLLSVVGVLPLYWMPPTFGWLTILRHLKTVPYLYSLFIFAAAIVTFLHTIQEKRHVNGITNTKDET